MLGLLEHIAQWNSFGNEFILKRIDKCSLPNVNTLQVTIDFHFNRNKDGRFIVSTLRNLIDSKAYTPNVGTQVNCSNVVTLKIRFFIRKVFMNRIHVAANLEVRGMKLRTDTCPLCNKEKETVDHLFVDSKVVLEVKEWIFKWCGISDTSFNNVTNLIIYASNWGNNTRTKERLNAIIYGMVWFIRIARNSKLFKKINTNPTKITNEVISQTYA